MSPFCICITLERILAGEYKCPVCGRVFEAYPIDREDTNDKDEDDPE